MENSCDKKKKKHVKRVFVPTKRFRYLKGSVNDQVNQADLKNYNTHLWRVFCAIPKVDCQPFKLNPYHMYKVRKLRDDLIISKQIDKENKLLLKKINLINRMGVSNITTLLGRVDTYNPHAYDTIDSWKQHEKAMKRIERDNKTIYNLIVKSESLYNTKHMNDAWKVTKKKIMHICRYPLVILKKDDPDISLHGQPSISEGLELIPKCCRPYCFLDFQVINGEFLGRVIIELYFEYVPVTVQNFYEICTGRSGLTYKNCIVHRIVKGKFMETGDIIKGTGRDGFSIYGKSFQEENHMLKHSKAGVISMKRIRPAENNSQFCITFNRMEELDHKNVVFGRIIKGNSTIFKIQDYGRKIGKPYAEIRISNCGDI